MVDTTTLSPDSQQNFKTKMDIPVITNNRSDTILSEELQGDATDAAASSVLPKIQVDGGPLVSKPKITWTHINKMDFGLSGLSKAFNMTTLGKRTSQGELNARQTEDLDTVSTKHGKVGSDVGGNDEGSAGVMPHPCREQ